MILMTISMIISRMKTEKKTKKERKASEETPELSLAYKQFLTNNRYRGIECEKRRDLRRRY